MDVEGGLQEEKIKRINVCVYQSKISIAYIQIYMKCIILQCRRAGNTNFKSRRLRRRAIHLLRLCDRS